MRSNELLGKCILKKFGGGLAGFILNIEFIMSKFFSGGKFLDILDKYGRFMPVLMMFKFSNDVC